MDNKTSKITFGLIQNEQASPMSSSSLHHCRCSTTTMLLSKLAISYLIASVVYLVVTREFGTPFLDSLTEEQKRVMKTSKERRGRVFYVSFLIAFLLLVSSSSLFRYLPSTVLEQTKTNKPSCVPSPFFFRTVVRLDFLNGQTSVLSLHP